MSASRGLPPQEKGTRAATCWTDQSLLIGFVTLEAYRGRSLFENNKLVFSSSFCRLFTHPVRLSNTFLSKNAIVHVSLLLFAGVEQKGTETSSMEE